MTEDVNESLEKYGIEILNSKRTLVPIDESMITFIINYLPKIPIGQFMRLNNPKGIYKLIKRLKQELSEEEFKITTSNKTKNRVTKRILSIYKIK